MTFQLEGMKELIEVLQKFPANQAYNVIRIGILRGAELVAERAKTLAPVDSGNLRDSIKARRASGRGKDIVRALVEAGGGKGKKSAWYANIVEKGHLLKRTVGYEPGKQRRGEENITRIRKKKEATGHVPAKPFMVPAVEQTKDEVIAAIEKGIRDEINFKIANGFKARRTRGGGVRKAN